MVKPPSPQTTSNTVRLSDLGTDTTGFIYLPTRTGGSARFPLTVLRDKDLDTAHKAFPERNLASLETHPGRRDRGRKKAEFASATALLRARAEYYGGREPAQTGDELEREMAAAGEVVKWVDRTALEWLSGALYDISQKKTGGCGTESEKHEFNEEEGEKGRLEKGNKEEEGEADWEKGLVDAAQETDVGGTAFWTITGVRADHWNVGGGSLGR